MTLDDAVDLVLYGLKMVSKRHICSKVTYLTIKILAEALIELFNAHDLPIENIGIRHGRNTKL